MRTEPPSPLASALARLRTPAGRARRWLAARGTATRVALLVAALGALGAAGYLATVDYPATRSLTWIFEDRGRRLSSDDLTAISEALDAEGIPHVSDPAGRVGVRPDRKNAALAALAKRKVVPPTLDELSRELEAPSPWEGPLDRERRETAQLERKLKVLIEGLDPAIASAHVQIHRVRSRGGLGANSQVSAFIHLQTEGGRTLGSRVVEGIETFLHGTIPDLKPEAITVADQTGHNYLAAGNPALKEQNLAHAQEEKWREGIIEGLGHIQGVGVVVLLEQVAVPAPPPEPPPAFAAEVVRPNGALEVEPDPVPPPPGPPPMKSRANVWVRIPRSFYHLAYQAQGHGRNPSPDDLKPMQATTEKLVHDAVEAHIPHDVLGDVKIDNVQDDLAGSWALKLPEADETTRPWPWLALYGAVGLSGALAAAAALIRIAARRPSASPSRTAWRSGYVDDPEGGPNPGPSERVRDLIRLNPEAAAGVLQRWIGQGGVLE